MHRHPLLTWIALAGLGLVIAAAITIEASRLAHPNVGLSAEPPYAGAALVPSAAPSRPAQRQRKSHATATRAVTSPSPSPVDNTASAPPAPASPAPAVAPPSTTPPTASGPQARPPQPTPQPSPSHAGEHEHADD